MMHPIRCLLSGFVAGQGKFSKEFDKIGDESIPPASREYVSEMVLKGARRFSICTYPDNTEGIGDELTFYKERDGTYEIRKCVCSSHPSTEQNQ